MKRKEETANPCCLIEFKTKDIQNKMKFLKEKFKEKTYVKTLRKMIDVMYDYYKNGKMIESGL